MFMRLFFGRSSALAGMLFDSLPSAYGIILDNTFLFIQSAGNYRELSSVYAGYRKEVNRARPALSLSML